MKKKRFNFVCGLALLFLGQMCAQVTTPPPVLHREITWAGLTPEGPAVFQAVPLFVGEGQPTNQVQSGEDWWYDTKPIYENGMHTGYIVVGFTTYKNMYFSEHELNPPGFVNYLTNPIGFALGLTPSDDCARLLATGETLSEYRHVISRFDLKGRMIWCKPLNYSLALNSVIQAPDGTFYAVGDTKAGYKYSPSNPEKYIYNPTSSSTQALIDKVEPVDITNQTDANRFSKTRIVIYHFDQNGNTLWSNLYGYEDLLDLSSSSDPNMQLNSNKLSKMSMDGVDLSMNSAGDELIIVGNADDGSGSSYKKIIFLARIDNNGYLLQKRLVDNGEINWVKSVSCNQGKCVIAGGNQDLNGVFDSDKGLIYKFNENDLSTDVTSGWSSNPRYFTLNNNTKASIFNDIELENDGKIVCSAIDMVDGLGFFGAVYNEGNAKLIRFSADANILQSSPIALCGAYDFRVGITKTMSGGYAVVSSVNNGFIDFTQQPNLGLFQQYSNSISTSSCLNPSTGLINQENYWNTDTYIAKFDQNLTKLWETSFDSDDQAPQAIPGDIKKQECMYRIAEAADGKLFVVGNSSHNVDDYYAALCESDCQQYETYDFPAITVPMSDETVINGNVDWLVDKSMKGIVRIKPNATLNITNATVEIANSQIVGIPTKFIVEPGGRLNITNSTLTCIQTCGKQLWDGIDLLGQITVNQTEAAQGKIVISNSVIEYAKDAITIGDYHDFSKNGGIVNATNTIFRNNNRSIQYLPYQNKISPSSVENNNLGFFDKCTFEWTDDFVKDAPAAAITMCGVKGIDVRGCKFEDKRVNTTLLGNRARGIYTIDAGYSVRGKSISGIAPSHDYFSTSGYYIGEFINMYRAIENTQGGSIKPLVVDHVRFTNCHNGIVVSGTDNPFIFRNEFNFTDQTKLPFSSENRREVSIIGSTGYQIEGNLFKNDDHESTSAFGCSIDNSGIEENLVRKNKYNDLNTGNFGQRSNRNSSVFSIKGLQFLCNTHVDNKLDMRNFSATNTDGIRLEQGAQSQSSANTITQNLPSNNFNLNTNESAPSKYFYFNSNENPLVNSLNVLKINSNDENDCQSRFSYIYVDNPNSLLASGMRPQIQDDLSEAELQKSYLATIYEAHLADGNDAALYASLAGMNGGNASSVYDDLRDASPYLSLDLMYEVGEKPTELFDESWFIQLIKDNIEIFEDADFRSFLVNKTEPLTNDQMNELSSFSQTNTTARGTERSSIGVYTTEIEHLQNVLLMDHLMSEDVNDQNALPTLVSERDHYVNQAELVDLYFGQGKYYEAQQVLDNLSSSLESMPLANVNEELENFIDLKTFLLEKVDENQEQLTELSDEEVIVLEEMRETFVGKAREQVNNILCFYKGNCIETIWLDGGSRKPESSEVHTELNLDPSMVKQFILYPNPNSGSFVISSEKVNEIHQVEVYDIQGKKVYDELPANSTSDLELKLEGLEKGVYLVHIKTVNGIEETIRMIKK